MPYRNSEEKKKYIKKWRENNRDKGREYSRRRRIKDKNNPEKMRKINQWRNSRNRRLKELALVIYGEGKCTCCGEGIMEFLTIDHIDGGGKEHRKEIGMGNKIYHWLYKEAYPPGFQVLCFNCNCAKGIYGKCPHGNL